MSVCLCPCLAVSLGRDSYTGSHACGQYLDKCEGLQDVPGCGILMAGRTDVDWLSSEGVVMGRAKLAIPTHQLEVFCRRHHIRKLALFGSVLRDDFGPDSDVDVLVEFEPGHVPGLAFF